LAKLGHVGPRVNSAEFGRNELGSYKQKVSTKDEEGAAAVNPDSFTKKRPIETTSLARELSSAVPREIALIVGAVWVPSPILCTIAKQLEG
jgi:hypothetical protein